MSGSYEELFLATRVLIESLERKGHRSEADMLKEGFASLNGLTDGWALFLDVVREVERSAAPVFTDAEEALARKIHDAAYQAVYRRTRAPWWKFW